MPKEFGGLGIGDILMKNTTMLYKWWWRFAAKPTPLWKKIVCSRNNFDAKQYVFNLDQISSNSP